MSEISSSNINRGFDEGYDESGNTIGARVDKQMEQLVPDSFIDGTDDIGGDMDLVNGPNPWLPAYGFQIQHQQHANFQPHEDLRANDTNLVQQVDFLETILEETSDDLQSDSDRSGTTYWLGSDSETESVIHIKSNQRVTDERPDGSGSECNSVVPKKRRRRNGAGDSDSYVHVNDWASPRSSRSSASSRSSKSSRSSSLIQFETLERTCATVSPSGYSYDSLEYSNRSNFENTSPDSLEDDNTDDDDDRTLTNVKKPSIGNFNDSEFAKIRPYRSYESLTANKKSTDDFDQDIGHGFMFAKTTSNDLSKRGRRSTVKSNNCWYDKYDDSDEDSEDFEDDDDDYSKRPYTSFTEPRNLLAFSDPVTTYSTSLDCRNTIDLREIGLEPKHETIQDLARSQIGSSMGLLHSKLNIPSNMASGIVSGQHDQRGWSNTQMQGFNFRMTNKSRSVPGLSSLATGIDDSPSFSHYNHNYSDTYDFQSSNLFDDNYTRVASVPINLNLCGTCANNDSQIMNHKMSDEMADMTVDVSGPEVINSQLPKRTSSVRTQKRLDKLEDQDHDIDNVHSSTIANTIKPSISVEKIHENDVTMEVTPEKTIVSTVKTQDRGDHVLEMAMAMQDNDIDIVVDEAIKQLKRQVEEATSSADMITFVKDKPKQRKIKNNASYELAQQWQVLDNIPRMTSCIEDTNESCPSPPSSPSRRRVHNNASYELAQQSDYIKALQSTSRPFQRMDACDELAELTLKNSTLRNNDKPMENSNVQITSKSKNNDKASPNSCTRVQDNTGNVIDQIKKNSEIFSIYGDGASVSPINIDDEVDLPCLETKPIDGEININYVRRLIDNSEVIVNDLDEMKNPNLPDKVSLSFISDFYPEQTNEILSKLSDKNRLFRDDVVNGEKINLQSDKNDVNDGAIADFMPGECLWRVVVEQQNAIFGKEWGRELEVENIMEKEENVVVGSPSQARVDDTSQGSVHTVTIASSSVSVTPCIVNDTQLTIGKSRGVVDENIENQSLERNKGEMSAIAAKRLAVQSSSPRNSQLITKNEAIVTTPVSDRKKSGLGGFLQRFSKLRFSGRSKVPRSEIKKSDLAAVKVQKDDTTAANKRKKEPDYIIIPLHPPEEERKREEEGKEDNLPRNRNEVERSASCVSGGTRRPPVCSSKPPLPPLPPQGGRASATSPRATQPGVVNPRRRATTDLGSPAAIEMAKARAMQQQQQQQHQHHHSLHQVVTCHQEARPAGLLETDLDDESVNVDHQNLRQNDTDTTDERDNTAPGKKTRSLLNLNHTCRQGRDITENINVLRVPQSTGRNNEHSDHSPSTINHRPHKSMEFLLDKENLHFIKPPENELQKVGERVPSEHELRVQRSLQRLNVPDWYKNSPAARDGFRLKRHSDASQHGGWRSLGSKTTSLSSLSSSSNRQAAGNTGTIGPLLSPSPTPPVFSRWSTSLLNSAGSSPANSARSSFNHRQPYLGWRSQERLANPRTPAERLAQGILPQLQNPKTIEVRNSIKEVTSAIVHYVQSGQEVVACGIGDGSGGRLSPRPRHDDRDDRGGARSTSPRGSVKLCWMESSFVGSRRVDSPETPMSLATDTECCTTCNAPGTESCSCMDSATSGLYLDLTPTRDEPRHKSDYDQQPRSTCRCPSPSPSTCHHKQQKQHRHTHQQQRHHRECAKGGPESPTSCPDDRVYHKAGLIQRRKSEGSDIVPCHRFPRSSSNIRNRRVSFDSGQEASAGQSEKLVKCRNHKCNNGTTLGEAKRIYKSCHNCTYLYCSKECRRAHWPRHRRTCLHYRVGTLCRQVLSSAKADPATIKHISALAKRGYAAHGRGAVKCFFTSPETAEKFIGNGFKDLGEPTYVRCSDLLTSEMGAELYAEIMRLCKTYNAETRLVLFVAVCVVSEVPSNGAVRWERQLVSRCGKIRLDAAYRTAPSASLQNRQGELGAVGQGQQLQPSPSNHPAITREMDSPETLVLTSLPEIQGHNTTRRTREIGFTNIQRQLRQRGVSLRRHFPQVYTKLCSYVDGNVDKFAPVTIYPRDQASGKSFMCIIMLDAEPERLQLLPTDSSRVRTVDISVEQE